jgi:hypothetical protein
MGGVSLTGNDTIALGSTGAALRILADLADGDTGNLDFPNNLVEAKVGKNGNTIYAFNASGKVATLILRVLLGSPDDKFLNAEMNLYLADPAAYPLLAGEFIKRVGDGSGAVNNIVYKMDGGIVQKMVPVKENVEGDTEQSVGLYTILMANNDRGIS